MTSIKCSVVELPLALTWYQVDSKVHFFSGFGPYLGYTISNKGGRVLPVITDLRKIKASWPGTMT